MNEVDGMSESETVELRSEPQKRKRSGFWREASGALALGLCVLAALVVGFQVVAWIRGTPGPGAVSVAGHLLAAGIAVGAQWFADHRGSWQARAAVVAVFVVSAVALWMFWWA
jgi:uncharacterized membrane protein YcjF (UPF0283 family)